MYPVRCVLFPHLKVPSCIVVATKMQVIKQYEGGKKVNVIARDLKLSHSPVTVSTILKVKERQRTGTIHEMEKFLHVWMEDQIQKQTPLSLFTLQTKARSISLMSQMRRTELFREPRRLRGIRSVFCKPPKRGRLHDGKPALKRSVFCIFLCFVFF